MLINALKINDVFEIVPELRKDNRGEFFESYRSDLLKEHTGRNFEVKQANTSISGAGVFRGIHFTDLNPGQAKYVTCNIGKVLDYVIDIRVGSPTFGHWDSIILDSKVHNSIFIPEGLGHGFLSLSEGASVSYLVSDTYKPEAEHGIYPLDPEIGLKFNEMSPLVLSHKDANAPRLSELLQIGKLPDYGKCKSVYTQNNDGSFK